MSHTSNQEPLWFAPQRKGKSGWICFKDSPSPPAVPDYTAAAKEQGVANVETAIANARLNNPNIFSPYGTQTVNWNNPGSGTPTLDKAAYDKAVQDWQDSGWREHGGEAGMVLGKPQGPAPVPSQFMTGQTTGAGGVSTPTITQTLNPQSQAIFDAQQATRLGLANLSGNALNTAQNVMNTPFNYNGPAVQTSYRPQGNIQNNLDLSGVAKMPVNAGMTGQQAIMSRLQPQIQQGDQAYAASLSNQGIVQGSEAYNNAMRVHNQSNNDLLSQAALQGINLDLGANQQGYNQALQSGQFGNQAQNQQYNQGLASAQFGNTAQQQAFQQQLYQRELPLNEISALMSGSQVQNPQFPNYQGASIAPAPLFNASQMQYNSGLQNYSAQNSANNATTSGLFSLGAAAIPLMFSDRRLKSNIERIGTHPLGIGIYSYKIFGKSDIGVMADEVLTVKPEAVSLHPSGFMQVDYGRL